MLIDVQDGDKFWVFRNGSIIQFRPGNRASIPYLAKIYGEYYSEIPFRWMGSNRWMGPRAMGGGNGRLITTGSFMLIAKLAGHEVQCNCCVDCHS